MEAIKKFIRTSFNRRQIVVGIITFILGFGLVTQLKVQGESSLRLSDQPESDLTEIISQQSGALQALRSETTELKVQLAGYQVSSVGNAALVDDAKESLANMRTLLGHVAVTGPGLDITITDENGYLTGFDIRQLVEELRSSGAQAISVNDVRVAADSSFFRKKGIVYLDNHELDIPFVIKTIGNADVLHQSVVLPRGVKDKLSAFDGVELQIQKSESLYIPAVDEVVLISDN